MSPCEWGPQAGFGKTDCSYLTPEEYSRKILNSANPEKRVKWWTKLGEFENKIGPLFPLSSLMPNGGLTTRIRLTILREYPTLFFIDDQTAKFGSKRREGVN